MTMIDQWGVWSHVGRHRFGPDQSAVGSTNHQPLPALWGPSYRGHCPLGCLLSSVIFHKSAHVYVHGVALGP